MTNHNNTIDYSGKHHTIVAWDKHKHVWGLKLSWDSGYSLLVCCLVYKMIALETV
jgi:hypothetical protein